MEDESLYARVRVIADEVLAGIPHVGVDVDGTGHAHVSIDLMALSSGERTTWVHTMAPCLTGGTGCEAEGKQQG